MDDVLRRAEDTPQHAAAAAANKEKTMKRFWMTVGLAGLSVLVARPAYAQSAQSAAPAGLEGTWRVEVIASDCAGHERP